MKKWLLILLSAFAITACGGEEAPEIEAAQSAKIVKTKQDFEIIFGKNTDFTVNNQGVVIFAKARDMFGNFNDYREDEGEVKFLSEVPLSILITKNLDENEKELARNYAEMSFLYAVYRTFMNTLENEVTVDAYPVIVTAKGKKIPQKQVEIKATINREKALDVLKKYTKANAISDLVQTEENKEYRSIGYGGSKFWDELIYNEKERSNIVADLIKE